jgi:hypothetical protein
MQFAGKYYQQKDIVEGCRAYTGVDKAACSYMKYYGGPRSKYPISDDNKIGKQIEEGFRKIYTRLVTTGKCGGGSQQAPVGNGTSSPSNSGNSSGYGNSSSTTTKVD